jgi:AraC-like DNA-binding protein
MSASGGEFEASVILTEDPRLQRLLRYVKDNLARPISLAEAAQLVGLERTYFSRFFRSAVGFRFSDWSRGLRIEKAKVLLRRRGPTVFAVAITVGYADITTFERAFKKQTGFSPRVYRNECEPQSARQIAVVVTRLSQEANVRRVANSDNKRRLSQQTPKTPQQTPNTLSPAD